MINTVVVPYKGVYVCRKPVRVQVQCDPPAFVTPNGAMETAPGTSAGTVLCLP